jgi:hypothetical protein
LSGAAAAGGFCAAALLRGVAGGAPNACIDNRVSAKKTEVKLREIKRSSENTTFPV